MTLSVATRSSYPKTLAQKCMSSMLAPSMKRCYSHYAQAAVSWFDDRSDGRVTLQSPAIIFQAPLPSLNSMGVSTVRPALNARGAGAYLVEEQDGLRLRGHVELRGKDLRAQAVLAQRRGALPLPHVTAHGQAVSVLATGVAE